jgi:hypothetical protein
MPQPIASRINNDGRGESVAYLRQLGALDESDPEAEGMPQVMATFNGTNIIKKADKKHDLYIYIEIYQIWEDPIFRETRL